MEILVTGASGVLGRRVVRFARDRGHAVRAASRAPKHPSWVTIDLESGRGLVEAVTGVDAVIHCASDSRRHTEVDRNGTGRLIDAVRAAGGPHVAFPGIVGSDVIPLRYYRSKTAVEEALLASGLNVSIQRFTQFHQLVWLLVGRLARWPAVVVPRHTRFQVLDPSVAAERLVSAVEAGATGRLVDVGGPTAYEARDLAGSVLRAKGMRRPVVAVNAPGLVGAALRAGGNLTEHRAEDGMTWNEFLAGRIDQA